MGYENETIKLIELLKNKRWQTRYNALISLIKLGDSSALEIVKKILNEDENAHVREIAVEYLKLNNSFPLKPVTAEEVKLYPFPIKNTHTILGIISVTSDPTLPSHDAKENIKYKLKQEAAELGANAVIKINCGRKFLLFRQFKAKGYAALIKDAPEKVKFEKSNQGILLGILFIIMGLSYSQLFNSTFNPFSIFFLGSGLFIFTASMFEIKQYDNDKLYLTIIVAIIISMLILTYIQVSLSNVKWWL
jgi:hypothetical protein